MPKVPGWSTLDPYTLTANITHNPLCFGGGFSSKLYTNMNKKC